MSVDLKIAEPLAQALNKKGYDTLTAVQEAVMAPDTADRDLLVSAQTGSGKTVAFGLALASSLLDEAGLLPVAETPLALIIAPTRELAVQVRKELEWLYEAAGGRIASCIGGMDMRDERRALSTNPHIVVGTPGRLIDHLHRNSLDISEVKAVVLDEADEMLNMGFREELEEILEAAPVERRTLLFSATVSRPIARLAENYQRDALRLNTIDARVQHGDIEYAAVVVNPTDVERAVINLLLYHDAPNALVFCARRDGVNKLTARLNNRGFPVVALSGEFSQKERSNALLAMRDGRAKVCVATDVAARGIDLPGLDLVIHADLPSNKETLLHRSGRTGRAGRKGVSVLITPTKARRRAERVLRDAGVNAKWGIPPSTSDIQKKLDDRVLAHPAFEEGMSDSEKDVVTSLVARYEPYQLATAFVRQVRAGSSLPEELDAPELEPDRSDRRRDDRRGDRRGDRDSFDRAERPTKGRPPEFKNGSWVSLGVGRRQSADPKWLVPMLCKAGGFDRDQIGSIKISPNETHVELMPEAANQLMKRAGEKQIIDKSLFVQRVSGPDETITRDDMPERKQRAERSAPRGNDDYRRNDRTKRDGPKKPRGPDGEKRRSPKRK